MPGFLDRLLGRGRDADDDARAAPPDGGAGVPGRSTGGPYTSAVHGALPPAEGGAVGDVALPPGVLVTGEGGDLVIWISAAPVAGIGRLWPRLSAAFADSGLWPVIMNLEAEPAGMEEIFAMPRGPVSPRPVRDILSAWSSENDGNGSARLAAATAASGSASIDGLVEGLTGHLGLVPVSRPADLLAATGWTGAANYDQDPREQSAVLRSWEDRFDAYLVGLGWDTITTAVGRPPRDRATARAIAEEHYAFCLDNIDQGIGDVEKYGDELVGAPIWQFWWD